MVDNKKLDDFKAKIDGAKTLTPDISFGLNNEQVQSRIDDGLTNKTPKRVTKTTARIIKDNLLSFFNILLFLVGALYIFVDIAIDHKTVFDTFRDCLFLGILLCNIIIGFAQDFRARSLCQKLQVVSEPRSRVLRNGEVVELKNENIVLSDILILKTGDQISADCVVLDGSIDVNESILTGESLNITKKVNDKVFSGTFVISGSAKCLVTSIGIANYAETLQDKAKEFKRPKSEIITSINYIFRVIGSVVVTLGIVMAIKLAIQGSFMKDGDATRGLLTSLVSMIPSGMFLLTSIALTVGVINLARKRVLVQEMYCIESLARVDTLCLDKTGTITDGSLRVVNVHHTNNISEGDLMQFLYTLVSATQDENATAIAIKKAFNNFHVLPVESAVAFSSASKYSAVNLENGKTIVLGAKEFLNINDEEINKLVLEHEKRGLRVLVVGESKTKINSGDKLNDLIPLGVIVLEDHIKDDAFVNIKWFKDNGVDVKVISGDNAITVSYIAARVGVENADHYISLAGLSDDEVREVANKYTVFGRVTPEQKEILISEIKKAGHKVAMTGDGVNDILALKQADCSIAMASGSAAARNASHIVMLDSDFSRLPDVVAEGRRVINNLQRSDSLFLAKTIFAIITTIFFLFTKKPYPFQTPMMFVWEYIFIGIGAFFLSLQPNSGKIKNGFLITIIANSIPAGLTQASMVLSFFILEKMHVIPENSFIIYSVMAFSIFAFIFLCKVCWKFDFYRLFVSVFLLTIAVLLFIFDFRDFSYKLDGGLFSIANYYPLLEGKTWWIMFLIIGIHIVLYSGLVILAHWVKTYHANKISDNVQRRFKKNENK